jgi:hypothetical protein
MNELSEDPKKIPNAVNIINAMKELVKFANDNQDKEVALFLHYSGHGSNVKDLNGDERDGRDECICSLDKFIIDDDLRKVLVDPLPKSARLTCIFDCCHSGSILDLRYTYTISTNKTKVSFGIDMENQYQDSKGKVVCISGCLDNQTSADAYINNTYQGALTYGFLETFKNTKKIQYKDLFNNLRILLKSKRYDQIPQMSSGELLNLNEVFNL